MHASDTDPGSAPAREMAVEPSAVVGVARGWDEQHVDLRVAAVQVADAATAGFTPHVTRAVADFLRAWSEHTGAAAQLSQQQADALRDVLGAWLRADAAARVRSSTLSGFVEQWR